MTSALFNSAAGRYLVEGDEVKVVHGPKSGAVGMIVGFDPLSESAPIVLATRGGFVQVAANEAEVFPLPPRFDLEPLDIFPSKLAESWRGGAISCGRYVGLPLQSGGVLTLIPKSPVPLGAVLCRHAGKAGLLEALRHGFVSRVPHVVLSWNSRLGALMERCLPPTEAVGYLLQ